MSGLAARAVVVLSTAEPADKIAASLALVADWQAGRIDVIGSAEPPARPARPQRPPILPPGRMRRRGAGGSGKATLLHALAHIEFNAVDLAWDMVARFTSADLPPAFHDDWVRVAADESRHFLLLRGLLTDLGSDYGAFPAHGGLWQAAENTAGDLLARLAVVPLTLEARALDTAPPLMAKLRQARDQASLAVMQRILDDEITHVAIGVRWFDWLCRQRRLDPALSYQTLVSPHFRNGLKPPFNHADRARAGLPANYYQPIAAPQ